MLSILEGFGLEAALCGGWAEEAFGLIEARQHADIDLVIWADDFSKFDELHKYGRLRDEVLAKRFAHKRAFMFSDILIEMYLVQNRGNRFVTLFWDEIEYEWISPLIAAVQLNGMTVKAVTPQNLLRFRHSYQKHEPWRWKDPASLIPLD